MESFEHLTELFEEVPVETLASCDPTPTKMYLRWLIRNFSNDMACNYPDVLDLLRKFSSARCFLNKKDIFQYKSYQELRLAVFSLKQFGGRTISEAQLIDNLKEIYSDELYSIYTTDSPNHITDLCCGLAWPANEFMPNSKTFAQELSKNNLFIVCRNLDDAPQRFAILSPNLSIMLDASGDLLKLDEELKNALINCAYVIADARSAFYFSRFINARVEQIEPLFIGTQYLKDYVFEVAKTRIPIAEDVFIKNPNLAQLYAINIIKNRWIEAEGCIFGNPIAAKKYIEGIKCKIPEREADIEKLGLSDIYAFCQTKQKKKSPISMKEVFIKERILRKHDEDWFQ